MLLFVTVLCVVRILGCKDTKYFAYMQIKSQISFENCDFSSAARSVLERYAVYHFPLVGLVIQRFEHHNEILVRTDTTLAQLGNTCCKLYELYVFSIHSLGVIPVSRRKVRVKAVDEAKPHCWDMSFSFRSGCSSIRRLASFTRSALTHL